MEGLGIKEIDLVEKFILGSGKGGQKINKTANCVYLKHLPTGIEVKCQTSRLRTQNRCQAREELCERLEQAAQDTVATARQLLEKLRRQNRKRSTTQKRIMLENKRQRGALKRQRNYKGDASF
jgi:peptide chain release factor